jgi:aminopeptidase N
MNGIFEVYSDTCVPTQDNFSLYNAYAHINNINVFYQYYVKPVVAYMLFMEMVGEDKFLDALREFVRKWQGKHPTPYDLFYTFNDVLDENYNWYWNTWFLDFGYPDMGIEKQDKNIVVKRMGPRALPLPINLTVKYVDGTSSTVTRPMDIWKSGERQIRLEIGDLSKIKSVILDYSEVPDIDHSNNYIEIN